MIKSMTGFGTATREEGGIRISAEARSVNHRFLKVRLQLPKMLSALEIELDALVQRAFRRGSLTLTVILPEEAGGDGHQIDIDAALRYRHSIQTLWERLELKEPAWSNVVTPLLSLPGVVRSSEDGQGRTAIDPLRRKLVFATVESALVELDRSRSEEGASLRGVITDHGRVLRQQVEVIGARAPFVPLEQRDRLLQRARVLLQGLESQVPISESDLLRETILLADRAEITEELNRLRGHLALLEQILEEGGEIGRRLDFLLQEILRETNTIGSKANDTAIAHVVVDMKVEIERMKEQAQNLE